MVESTSLLTRQGLKALQGSNPCVSADTKTNTPGLVLLYQREDVGIRTAELGTLWASEPRPAFLVSEANLEKAGRILFYTKTRTVVLVLLCLRENAGIRNSYRKDH